MADKKGGLGRGFENIFFDNAADARENGRVETLPISEIEPDRGQPRTMFDEEALNELAASIREHGIISPIIVRPMSDGSYKIVAGERRYRAARRAELTEVPVIIRPLTDEEASAVALIENLQREDLNIIEEALGIRKLIEDYGFTQEQAAEKISKSRTAVTNTLRLLNLPQDTLDFVKDGSLSAGHARALLGLKNKEIIDEIAESVVDNELSVRETEALVKKLNKPEKKPTAKAKRPVFYDEVELSLSGTLARSVKIKNGAKGGKLEIEYFDDDDLKKLAMLFNED